MVNGESSIEIRNSSLKGPKSSVPTSTLIFVCCFGSSCPEVALCFWSYSYNVTRARQFLAKIPQNTLFVLDLNTFNFFSNPNLTE